MSTWLRRPAAVALMLAGSVLALLALTTTSASALAAADDPGDLAQQRIDALAQALRADRVVVDQTLGNGDADGAEKRLRGIVAKAEFPVYVALVADPGGLAGRFPSADLAARLHQRLGDGMYLVGTTTGIFQIEGWGVPDPVQLSLALTDARAPLENARDRDEGRRAVTTVAAAQMAAEMAATGPPYTLSPSRARTIAALPGNAAPPAYDLIDDDPRPASIGLRALAATAASLAVLLVGLRLLLWLTARRTAPATGSTTAPTDLDLVRLVAQTRLDADTLGERIAAEPASERTARASDNLLAARALLRDLEDLADPGERRRHANQLRNAVGAEVLVSSGRWELSPPARTRAAGRFVPCFFDPRHDEASGEVEITAGAESEVPACSRCQRAVRSGTAPQALVFPGRGRARPYYEEDTLWARTGYGALDGELWKTVLAERAGRRG